jgi:hypothetical protein
MSEKGSTNEAEQSHYGDGAKGPTRRLLKRPTTVETEQIARACPPNDLSVPVLVTAIRRETGCSRATAYRAVSDAFAAGVLSRKENAAS